jgi:ParB-like chromosome segregation protein Spo0J
MTDAKTSPETPQVAAEADAKDAKDKSKSKSTITAKPASISDLAEQADKTHTAIKSDNLLIVPLSLIRDVKYNGRREPEHLCEGPEDEVYVLVGPPDEMLKFEDGEEEMRSLLHMALSENKEHAERYVELINEYESVDRNEYPDAPQSIVELAEDITRYGQIVPAILKETKGGYTLLDGARRMAAIMYLHCKDRLNNSKSPYKPVLLAVTTDVDQSQLLPISFVLNNGRKNMTALQEGKYYHEMRQQVNPKTKKKYTLKEISEEVGVLYNTVRGREALFHKPHMKRDLRTGDMKQVGLTEEEREKVRAGEKSITWAMRKALGESQAHARAGEPPKNSKDKIKPLTRKEMESLFDKSGDAAKDFKRAIALCLGYPDTKAGMEKAEKDSESRILLSEQKAVKQAASKSRKKQKEAA